MPAASNFRRTAWNVSSVDDVRQAASSGLPPRLPPAGAPASDSACSDISSTSPIPICTRALRMSSAFDVDRKL